MEDVHKLLVSGFETGQATIDANNKRFEVISKASCVFNKFQNIVNSFSGSQRSTRILSSKIQTNTELETCCSCKAAKALQNSS